MRRAPLEIEDLRRLIAVHRPDALLVDKNSWSAATLAEAHGAPWVLLQHFPSPLPDPAVPPFGPGWPPPRGLLGRTRDAIARPLIVGAFERVLIPPLNELRAGVGVVLARRQLSPERIRAAVERARGLRPAVAAYAQAMRSEGGAPLAVDRLEELVSRAAGTAAS